MWVQVFKISFSLIPKPKGRPRFTKKGFAFTPAATRKAERDIAAIISEQVNGRKPIDNAIRVEMEIIMPRPKSHFGTGNNSGKIKGSSPMFPTTKPDIDNLEKAFLDAAEGILWVNDSRIVQKETYLWYADECAPGYNIVVEEWKNDNAT